jgi:hypothetical protein
VVKRATVMTTTPQLWDGTCLGAGSFSLVVFAARGLPPPAVPVPVIAAVSDGRAARVVSPAQLGPFLRLHPEVHLACHEVGELHWVLHGHLGRVGDAKAQQVLWRFAAEGRLHDGALLDQLVRLAQQGSQLLRPRTLCELAERYANSALADEAAVQGMIAASATHDPPHADPALAGEATRHADVTRKVVAALWEVACIAGLAPNDEAAGGAGLPSLALQVQGDVALAHARYNGLSLVPGAVKTIVTCCQDSGSQNETTLLAATETHPWLRRTADNHIKFQPDGSPGVRHKAQETWLAGVLGSLRGLYEHDFAPPLGANGRLSTAPEDWGFLARCHRLLRAHADLTTAPAVARACAVSGPLRPGYEVLPRIRSREPDLGALRRLCGQGLFQPAPGHRFLVVELKDLELRSLAAVLRQRGGHSRLAESFLRGADLYADTAAALASLAPGDFAALRTSDPPRHDRWLRVARALLTAAPMGLGVECVREVARAEFSLDDLGLNEARRLHARLLDLFPELGGYLRDDTVEVLAGNLGVTPADLQGPILSCALPHGPSMADFRGWFRGDNRRLPPDGREGLRSLLNVWNRNDSLRPLVRGAFDRTLYVALFGRRVTTLAGRVRGGMLFAEARQAEYLDLADDAAKSALFALAAGGFGVVAFAGNDIVAEVSVPEGLDARVARAETLARQAVATVLRFVPASCPARVLASW